MDLSNRVAVVTGGKRIGQAVAGALAARGVDLVLTYRTSREEALETVADVQGRGRRATVVAADLSKPSDCRAVVDHAVRTFRRLDILINMASIYREIAFDKLTEADWNADADINLRSAFLCAHAAAPHMRQGGGGRIVNFSDWVARSGRPRYLGYTSYYTAKAGLIGLTEALALELAADGILVNAIAPGPIVPPPDMSQTEIDEVARATPLGRWGGELEIAQTTLFLCETEFITGETIRVDGGRHLK
jgi:NAD(P)-dependent dehydrogenase (short-subunit alcohol dehydrogenase family)